MCVFPRHPESRLSGRLWHRPRGPAAYSLPLTYLKILRARRLCWLECRPELRNHGAGWMRAVERLRNGGVPRNPVFLMPATHCTRPTAYEGRKIPPAVASGGWGRPQWGTWTLEPRHSAVAPQRPLRLRSGVRRQESGRDRAEQDHPVTRQLNRKR